MLRKKYLIYLGYILIQLCYLNCSDTPFEYKSFNPETDLIGKTWAYQVLYLNEGNPLRFDSTYNWVFHECVKETTFNDRKWFHFKESLFRRELFGTATSYREYAIYIGSDSIYIFNYDYTYPIFEIYRDIKQNKIDIITILIICKRLL